MKKKDLDRFHDLISGYNEHPMVQHMKNFVQHGSITTYDHCHRVAKLSYWLNTKLHLHADEHLLVPAALLHDFFLYDWHDDPKLHASRQSHKGFTHKHGFTHAKVAADNARKYFDVSDKMHNVITSHMWPLNITKVPRNREAVILCFADKCVALRETLFNRKKHKMA